MKAVVKTSHSYGFIKGKYEYVEHKRFWGQIEYSVQHYDGDTHNYTFIKMHRMYNTEKES